jgi:hypothetical protein
MSSCSCQSPTPGSAASQGSFTSPEVMTSYLAHSEVELLSLILMRVLSLLEHLLPQRSDLSLRIIDLARNVAEDHGGAPV